MMTSQGGHSLSSRNIFKSFIGFILVVILLSIYNESYLFFVLPVLVLGFGWIINDYRKLFYTIFVVLPFSVEYYFGGVGLGTDLPSEPLMIFLSGITLMLWAKQSFSIDKSYIQNPIMIMMVIHIFWIFTTMINSENFVISLKLLTAKIWYILPFYIFPLIVFKDSTEFSKAYRLLCTFLFVSILIVLVRHAIEGFTFATSNKVVSPFFRNHVSYAAISVVALPFVWAFMRIKMLNNRPYKLAILVLATFVIGIYFSFTRAAIISMVIACGAWFVVDKRWVKQALIASSLVAIVGVIYLSWDNKYMDFAPDFEKTITHYEFDNLIEATYKLEDISSMERVYRWMAGAEMIKERFWMGFGPGSFYTNYKAYSISRFQTYVSDNPEKSGIHNYYLMTWVEQGIIGFIIFIALCFTILIQGENLYHRCTRKKDKYLIMATVLSFIIIMAINLINDLIETDKVGPFFFFNAAVLLFFSAKYPNQMNLSTSNHD